ncbi:putative Histidine kinase [Rhodospirillaceae bacterium LM-1]|nr:putative Histidine kinase [Rhodospirillaceae bacterium LM-1]
MTQARTGTVPESLSRHGRLWLFAIGFLALGMTALLWVRELHEEERRAKALFRMQSEIVAGEIEAQINLYAQLLRSAAGVHRHSNQLLRDEWRRYVEALDLDKNFPGVSGIALVKRVTASEKTDFVASARREWPDFKIYPEREKEEYYVNFMVEPERVYRAVGFDVSARDDRKMAADIARDSGEIAITAKTTLITPGASGSDLLMYLPLYRSVDLPKTVDLRRSHLWGWVAAGISIPQLMWSVHARVKGMADIAVYDGLDKNSETQLFKAQTQHHLQKSEHYQHDVLRTIGGRTWLFSFTSHPEFEDTIRTGRAVIILAAGVAATFLMTLTAWFLLSSRARVAEESKLRSEELERERDYANALLTASPAAILTLDCDGVVVRSNPAAGFLAGLKPDDLVNKTFASLFLPPLERSAFAWSLSSLKTGGGPLVLEAEHSRGDERRIINWTFSAVRETNKPLRYLVTVGIDVTPHRQAEDTLKAERALFVAGPVVVFRWRAETGWPVEYVSPNVAQFGCQPGALLSGELPFMNLLHPEDLGRVASEVSRFAAQGQDMFEQRYRLVRPSDGEERWVDDRTLVERDSQGKVVSYLGYLIDVTERERAEEAKRNSEARIARVLSMSSEGYWELNASERTIAVNPALLAMLDVDEASIMGRTPRDFIAPGWEDRMTNVMVERRSAANRRFEMAYLSSAGRVVHTRVNATSIFDHKGHFVGSYGLLTDITAEKVAEDAMRNEQGRLRLIVDSVPLALVISRLDEAVVVNANLTAHLLFGLGGKDMTGQSSYDFYADPLDRKAFIEQLRRDGMVTGVEARMRRGDGSTFWGLLSGRLIQFDGAECALISTQDISSRKQAETRLNDMAHELSRSNAELEQFAYVASHDLQEPLRMIASYVQLLDRRYGEKLDQDAKEYIAYAVEGAKRMQALITDLLEFSRVNQKSDPFIRVDLNRVVGDALKNLTVIKRECGAIIDVDPLPEVVGDPAQLVRLFQNLIGNAVKYRHPDRKPEVSVKARSLDEGWEIRVADNGIGIAENYFDRIFIIFQRLHTRGDYPGTGIGLALCKKIVERHGGHIRVESVEGQGSAFIFNLPLGQMSA